MATLDEMIRELVDINIESREKVITPEQVKEELPLTNAAARTVLDSRNYIRNILDGEDDRLIVITGPCSIHDYDAAIEFGKHIKDLSAEVDDKILLVMRTYFDKPRTRGGWEGLISDPGMDGSYDMDTGYRSARKLLLELAEMGVPTATEVVDIGSTPNYIDDCLGWMCIGARTVESQYHRKVASGLSMPIGMKNSTSGDIGLAVDGVYRVGQPSVLRGTDNGLHIMKVTTKGHNYAHVVLRGGNGSPNYHPGAVSKTMGMLEQAGLRPNVMIDCSHANSGKDHNRQPAVWNDVIDQRVGGNKNIIGIMLEANHREGNQPFKYGIESPSELDPYTSVTDKCISLETNAKLIREAYAKL